jgi:NAD(P)H dehydrogenase (quinone)
MTHASRASSRRVPRHAVILCHPAGRSFNGSVAHTYCKTVRSLGHKAILRDLYRLGFDPLLKANERPTAGEFIPAPDVIAEIAKIRGADIFVLVYPIWFGTPPAMMKGYVERVLGAGFSHHAVLAREFHPLLSGKHLLSITSSGNTIEWLDSRNAWMSLRNVFDNYIASAFSMASTEHLSLQNISENMEERDAREALHRVEKLATEACTRLLSAASAVDVEKTH